MSERMGTEGFRGSAAHGVHEQNVFELAFCLLRNMLMAGLIPNHVTKLFLSCFEIPTSKSCRKLQPFLGRNFLIHKIVLEN